MTVLSPPLKLTAQMPQQKTALVVETNYLVASSVEGPLLGAGFRVIVALDAEEAKTAISTHQLAVAVIDFRLQHGGPEGLVELLRAAEVPYVFCTASSTTEVVESFPGARVVEKPFGDDILLMVVTEVVNFATTTRRL